MTHAGARPMHILAAIQKEYQDTLVSATDIRGERKTIREKHLNGRSPMETLLDDLSTADWIFAVKKDDSNRVQKSLLRPPESGRAASRQPRRTVDGLHIPNEQV